MSGERAHAVAWREAIGGELGQWSAYDYDDVPTPTPDLYVLITVTRRFGSPTYFSGGRALVGWRLTTLAVGTTYDETRWVRDRIWQLADTTLPALNSTGLRFENENPIEKDGDRYTGITSWTYAAPT